MNGPRVLISGYYGFGNLGDEALLDVIVTRLRATYPNGSIDVLSADHDFDAQCDALVTCVMVVWALTIFVGMGCLAALI